jgi:hypothetical protein
LPYQVADEFLRRREEIIDSETASFQKALSSLEKWKSEQQAFHSLRGYLNQAGRIVAAEVAFLFDEQKTYLDAVEDVERAFREKIEQIAHTHSPLDADEDMLLERLLSLFDSKVGEAYDDSTLRKLYEEGEKRYKQSKPPGFMDAKEKDDERKYGDFILWKQILDFAKASSRPIIFVTGEKKEDWWIRKNGETTSPHTELRREFQEYVKQPFWMYRTQRFLEIATEKLTVEINQRSIEEANAIADANAADEQESVDQQSYESIRLLLEQMRNPVIDENTRQFLEQMRNPVIDENTRQFLEQMRNPVIDKNTRQFLEQMRNPVIDKNTRQFLEQMRNPVIDENTRQFLERFQKSPSDVRRFKDNEEQQRLSSEFVEREQLAEEVNSEVLDKKNSQVIDEVENHNQENASSSADELQNENKETKSKPKKRSSSRKRNDGNPEK